MSKPFPYTQLRIARPTANLDLVMRFYGEGLGLEQIGSFHDHAGYSGIMFGLPGEQYHLEFTQYKEGEPCPPPSKDNLQVFYFPGSAERDEVSNKLIAMGYNEVEPENPYWKTHGVTIEDPDGWCVVLMEVSGFRQA